MSINNTASENPIITFAEVNFGGGIEAQEARGQRELVQSTQLPVQGIETLAAIGVKVVGECPGDPLFVEVELPEGWSKRATGHSMWSELIDDKGRNRAGIFYKAAFYDRSAHVRATARYYYNHEPVGGYGEGYSYETTPRIGTIMDSDGNVVWQSDPFPITPDVRPHEVGDQAEAAAKSKIEEMFPNYRDVTAYWD